MAYVQKIAAQHVTHTEIFFDPQGHTERGIDFKTVIGGITRALKDAKKKYGISSKLIMSFLRHMTQEEGFAALKEAKPFMDLIDGFGLDSSEKGHPPSKFERLYAMLRDTGKPVMAHAGEEGPPEYVKEAIDLLKIDRIDHGNRSLEDPALVQRLVSMKIGLTVCPLSNIKLCVVGDIKQHPLKRMLDMGLKATVNSDDPAYFGGYMNENYLAVAAALDLSRSDIIQLAQNAIDVSFLSEPEKAAKGLELGDYVRKHNVA
jgi:adenosine deaminase